MDKYVYILVGIIWLVGNLYKSSQKKQQKSSAPTHGELENKKEKNIETILQEILNGQEPEKETYIPSARQEQKEIPSSQEIIVDEASEDTEKMYETAQATVTTPVFSYESAEPLAQATATEQEKHFAEEEHESVPELDFDFKRAIIYSEIINKPKYLD